MGSSTRNHILYDWCLPTCYTAELGWGILMRSTEPDKIFGYHHHVLLSSIGYYHSLPEMIEMASLDKATIIVDEIFH